MHRWYHHFVDCLPFISVLLSLFSSAVYISSSILCSSPLYSRELCTCFAVCLVYLNSLSNVYFSYSLLPLLNLTLRWPSLLPSPYIVLGLRSSPPPLHAHTTLSHSTTQPFSTLLLSTPARLVSRIQIKSINQSIIKTHICNVTRVLAKVLLHGGGLRPRRTAQYVVFNVIFWTFLDLEQNSAHFRVFP